MKTRIKAFLSVVLTIAICFGVMCPTVCAAAVKSESNDYDGLPIIMIRGMDFNGLWYKKGTPDEQNAFSGVNAGDIIKVLLKAIGSGVVHWSYESAIEEVIPYLNEILGHMACNRDGSSKYDISVDEYPLSLDNYPEAQDMGNSCEMGFLKRAVEDFRADNVYYFNYDWRIDPYINAGKINAMVNEALRASGKDKVNIACASMGGILTLSYLYRYGYEKVNKLIFMSSTFCGTYVTGDLFRGMIDISAENLNIYCQQSLGYNNKALSILFKVLYKTGIMGDVVNFANRLVPKVKDKVYDGFLRDTFGTMPALWALVRPDAYADAVEYVFGGREEEYSEIIALADEYQEMNGKRDELLRKAQNDGVQICVVAGYNSACIPVYNGGGCNGDSILESAPMLGNAAVAQLGETLGSSYVAKNPEKLSPDKVVDLSECLFPDNTWAICGSPHVSASYGTDYSDFIFWLLTYDDYADVKTDARYPQFMISSKNEDLRPAVQ